MNGSSNDGAIKDAEEPPRDDAQHELDAQHGSPEHKRLQRAGADFARQQMPETLPVGLSERELPARSRDRRSRQLATIRRVQPIKRPFEEREA
jgi:hypothetical protein